MREENIFLRKGYVAIPYFYGLIFLLFLFLNFNFKSIKEYVLMSIIFLIFFAFPFYILFKNHLTIRKFTIFLFNSIVASILTLIFSGLIINSGLGAGILAVVEFVTLFLIPLSIVNLVYLIVLIIHLITKNRGDEDEILN